ncbi:hypothetical protein [Parasediminibacterium sp. JCM 36343]|uniref:hypothetical protein n=1 Tax=Parasediminibacterium sp. JCM 36343 TaxID=3374279 RepID=UPI00397CB833
MKRTIHFIILIVCFLQASTHTHAAIYQWSVPLEGKDKESRAFLWVPPACKQVRGLIFANQVILEDLFCANKQIREACTKEGLGIVLVFRGPFTQFNYKEGASSFAQIQKVLDDLAAVSGYAEIATAPLLTIGHSGGANGAYSIAYCKPQRVFGILTLHAAAMVNPPEYDQKARIEGIPIMAVTGEYESWTSPLVPLDKHWRWLRGDLLDLRGKYEHSLVCEVVQPGAGHFNFDDKLAALCAIFVQKTAHYRIPAGTTENGKQVALNTLDETKGWLTDIHIMDNNRFHPVAFKDFKGDNTLTFWHLDEEMAKAVDAFPQLYGGKKEQRVCFMQNDKPVPASWINELAFQPSADGITFCVKAGYLTQTPEGVAGAGIPITHSTKGNIHFSLIGGWGGGGEQVGADSFRIRFDHFGTSRFCSNIQVMAYKEGDETYKYAEQPAQIKFPEKNTQGEAQAIDFPEIPAINDKTQSIKLGAVSSAGLPVYYYVKDGPAIVIGNILVLNNMPIKAIYPIKITVVAWQWGRGIPPLVQAAVPLERVVVINK